MVSGTRANAEQLRNEVAATLAPMGLRLSDAKTQVVHLNEGLDFLGFRIQRKRKRGHSKHYVYTYPSRKAVMAIKAKVRALTNMSAFPTLSALLSRVNSTLRGWAAYFQHGVSKRTFSAIGVFAWRRVIRWLRKRHHRASWASILRRYLPGWVPTEDGISLFNPVTVPVTRYRYRGNRIPNPWTTNLRQQERHDPVESRMLGNGHVRFGGRVRETDRAQARHRALTRPNTDLKQRGVQDILICCVDGLKGFPEAIEAVFPQTTVQTCIVHLIRHSLKYVPRRQYDAVVKDLKPIYTANNPDSALLALEAFEEKWGEQLPVIGQAWRSAWDYVIPFMAFPDEVRRVIYTTNAIEALNRQLRKAIKTKGHFPSEDAARKLIYLAIQNAVPQWTRTRGWTKALLAFKIHFGDRLPD